MPSWSRRVAGPDGGDDLASDDDVPAVAITSTATRTDIAKWIYHWADFET